MQNGKKPRSLRRQYINDNTGALFLNEHPQETIADATIFFYSFLSDPYRVREKCNNP